MRINEIVPKSVPTTPLAEGGRWRAPPAPANLEALDFEGLFTAAGRLPQQPLAGIQPGPAEALGGVPDPALETALPAPQIPPMVHGAFRGAGALEKWIFPALAPNPAAPEDSEIRPAGAATASKAAGNAGDLASVRQKSGGEQAARMADIGDAAPIAAVVPQAGMPIQLMPDNRTGNQPATAPQPQAQDASAPCLADMSAGRAPDPHARANPANALDPSVHAILVKSASFEKYLPPVAAAGPLQQISSAAIALARQPEQPSPGAGAQAAEQPASIRPPLPGLLRITLSPQDLGDVTISLHLRGQQLELRIEAQQAGTAQLVFSGSGSLREALARAGYDVGPISVRTLTADTGLPPARQEDGNFHKPGQRGQQGHQDEAFRRARRYRDGAGG